MMLQIQSVRDLPVQELAPMLAESKMVGFRAIDRLIDDWQTSVNRFDRPGEALFIARQRDHIIGICGLNCDPYADASQVGRVRRFYVMQDSRRQGVGRVLVQHLIQAAKPRFDWLHVQTTNPVAALFYQSLGFSSCDNEFVTHALNLAMLS